MLTISINKRFKNFATLEFVGGGGGGGRGLTKELSFLYLL